MIPMTFLVIPGSGGCPALITFKFITNLAYITIAAMLLTSFFQIAFMGHWLG